MGQKGDQVRSKARNSVLRATLLFLAAMLLAPLGWAQALQPGGPADFGSVTVGGTQRTVTLTFSASVTTVISSVIATTNGVQNQDFTIVFQTCTGVQAPPQSCTITLGFLPTVAGLRKGALSITDSTGTVVNRVFLHGIGLGPQVVFSPAPATVLASVAPFTPSGYQPSGAAIDGSGSLYFNDAQFDRILKQDSTGNLSVVDLLFSSANSGVAIDGAGTLYIAAGGVVYSLVPGSVAKPLATGSVTLTNATGIAVDGSGFVYISDTAQNHIVRVGQDGTTTVLALTGLGTPLSAPAGLAVDANNFLYIADSNNNRIVSAGTFTLAATVVPTTIAFSAPLGVAVDPSGALTVADTGNNRIVEVPPSGVAYVLATPGVTFSDPVNVTTKDNGDLVVADAHLGLVTLTRTNSTLSFPTPTGVGHLDTTDGALPVTVMNSGNVPLQVRVPTSNQNPSFGTTAFATGSTGTCPVTMASSPLNASTQILVGEVCTYAISFTPQTLGTNTDTAELRVQPVGGGTKLFPLFALTGNGIPNITQFSVVATPSQTQPGVAVSFTVSALDANGAVDPTYRGTATFATTDPAAKFLAGTTYTFTAADNGTHTFSAPTLGLQFNTLGTYTIHATDGTVSGTSNPVQVVQANGFTLVANPSTIPLNGTVALTVTATFNGVPATGFTGTLVFTSTDPAAKFLSGTTYTFQPSDNGTHTFPAAAGVQFNTVGVFTISATDGLFLGTSNPVTVAAANSFSIVATPSTVLKGAPVSYTVTALYNNATASNFTGPVTFTTTDSTAAFASTGTNTFTYTFTAADNGVHTFTAGNAVAFNTPGTYTIAAAAGNITGTSNAIKVVAADSFTITAAPTKLFVGQSAGYTVTAMYQGAVVTNYTGTVTFSTGDAAAGFLSGKTYTFTPTDNGTHVFPAAQGIQYNTPGTYTVGVTDGASSGVSNQIVVIGADAISIVASPTKLFVGQSAGYTVTVTAQGSVVTNFTGTVNFATGDPAAKFLSGSSYTFTAADNGTHTFTVPQGVQYNTAGTYTLTATSAALTGTSNAIQVIAADGFTIVASPTTLLTGQSTGFTVTATAQGATVTNFTGTVTFATGDPAAKFLSGTSYNFTAADNGVHTFAAPQGAQYNTPGVYTITATSGAATGTSNQITVIGVDGFTIVAAPANLLVGQDAGFTITAVYKGAVATGFTGTVTFSTTDPKAVFLGSSNTYTFTSADAGVHTFAPAQGVQFNSLGTFTINASDGTLTGVSNNIVVTNPTGVTLTSSANPVLVGVPITLTAVVTGSTGTPDGTVTFSDNGTPLGTATLVAGVATLQNVALTQLGLHPLMAVYSGSNTFTGSQGALAEVVEDFSIAVAPGASSSGSALVGHTATYTLLVSPVGGPTFAAPVTFTLSQELKGAKVVFTPASIAVGAAATDVTLAITPTQLQGMLRPSGSRVAPGAFALLLLPLVALRKRKRVAKLLMLVVALLPLTLMTGCLSSAADGYYGAAPQTYTMTVTATSGVISHTTQITISVQ